MKLNRGCCNIALNWSRGIHHVNKSEAGGFCCANNIAFFDTGHIKNTGAREGMGYSISVNTPLMSGMTDGAYEQTFKPIMDNIVEIFNRPGAILLQRGANSHTGNVLGCFNLSRDTTPHNIGRTRRRNYQTRYHVDYLKYYAPDCRLHMTTGQQENMNMDVSLEIVRVDLLKHHISI